MYIFVPKCARYSGDVFSKLTISIYQWGYGYFNNLINGNFKIFQIILNVEHEAYIHLLVVTYRLGNSEANSSASHSTIEENLKSIFSLFYMFKQLNSIKNPAAFYDRTGAPAR